MCKKFQITILPEGRRIEAAAGVSLLAALRAEALAPDAPCGGNGSCGKCTVLVDGVSQLACQTPVTRDLSLTLPHGAQVQTLSDGCAVQVRMNPARPGFLLAFDIGTTTIAGYLLNEAGQELATAGMLNPQIAFGADVVSRIQLALHGQMEALTACVRRALSDLTQQLCAHVGIAPAQIGVVSVVGNPCMQQLFLGLLPENLAAIPFSPLLTKATVQDAQDCLPLCENAALLCVPDISGYVGADTMGCVLSTKMYARDALTLMVDIGTNGEMVLGSRTRLLACSTAAGPALEGAKIKFGMRAAAGAIDRVCLEDGALHTHVIGQTEAVGICGSGLIDAIACLLELGLVNERGRLQSSEEIDAERVIYLTPNVYLTQNDIREVQMAKGAIAAGISLLAQTLGIAVGEIDAVLLAGAFGSFLNTENACRIGLLPPELAGKITAIGNAAGSGAKLLACDLDELTRAQTLAQEIEFLELANVPGFQREFAKQMRFQSRKG